MLTLNYYVKDFSEWLPKADRKEEPLALLGNLWSRFEKEVPEESRRDDPAVEESFVRILGSSHNLGGRLLAGTAVDRADPVSGCGALLETRLGIHCLSISGSY